MHVSFTFVIRFGILSLFIIAVGSDPKEKTRRKMLDKNCRWEDYLV